MGDRPYAKIVHGFSIEPREIEDIHEATRRWESEVAFRAGIVAPDDSAWGPWERIASACEFFGIEMRPAKTVLLAAYG